jgi:tetratricopeptide (TPR) repeat protein
MVGGVYCSVLEACSEILIFAARRNDLGSNAGTRPSRTRFNIVAIACSRAEILQLHGDWSDALNKPSKHANGCPNLRRRPLSAELCRRAELHRRWRVREAEEAHRHASQWERTPQPGFAQLRLAQGQIDAANTAIRHVAEAAREPGQRARVLDAYVEIVLAANDVPAARAAADELAEISARLKAQLVDAMWTRAEGAVLLAEQNPREALVALGRALTLWSDLAAPYETARVRVLIARACRDLGDHDTSDREFAAAREAFEQLGATPDGPG